MSRPPYRPCIIMNHRRGTPQDASSNLYKEKRYRSSGLICKGEKKEA